MRLVVGLGNWPKKYWLTRHNIGFMVVKNYVESSSFEFRDVDGVAMCAWDVDREVGFVLPKTYMNQTGKALLPFRDKIESKDILLIHDDLDLDWLKIRFRVGGSDAGHKGVRSVISSFKSFEFPRLRMGIDRPKDGDVVKYVLSEFSERERKQLAGYVRAAFAVIDMWIDLVDVGKIMSLVNADGFVAKYIGGENGAKV